MNIWCIKANLNIGGGKDNGWSWNQYEDNCREEGGKKFQFGGPDWIRSPLSKMLIREEVTAGDLAIGYQTDERSIYCLTAMTSDGRNGNEFDLLHADDALFLDPPFPVEAFRDAKFRPSCFRPGTQGTIFPVPSDEFCRMLTVFSWGEVVKKKALRAWLKRHAYRGWDPNRLVRDADWR